MDHDQNRLAVGAHVAVRYDLRTAAGRQDQLTLRRLEELVPALMSELDVDAWVVASREYADDAIAMTMLPADWFSTRRRTVLVFIRGAAGVERFSVSRYEMDGFFEPVWDPKSQPDQWEALADLLAGHSPSRIAVDISEDFAHGDGLTQGEYERLMAALPSELAGCVVPADPLSVHWLETRLPEEREVMATACARAHAILGRALSREAIQPGLTTTEDVVWWLRSQVQDLGTVVWFQPTVSVQRSDADSKGSFASKPGAVIIESGDLVHIDFGIVWDGLCTDQQQHGYVLGPGQSSVPEWADQALLQGNRMQDILTAGFELGRSGNEVLSAALQAARGEGIDGVVYTHPIGYHGHGAGPTIGLWDNQESIPGSGDRPLRANTAWSIELMVRYPVEDWGGRSVSIMLEEDAWFDGDSVAYLDGRQTEIWPI